MALLPVDVVHGAIALLAGGAALAAAWPPARARGVLVALAPLVLVLLPWLPFPVPAAFLLWTGPLLTVVWIACALGAMAAARHDITLSNAMPARRQCLLVAVLSFALFGLAAWSVAPSRPSGDEPHYLVITQSLLYDGDLKIENNHRRGDYHAYFAGDLNPDFIRRGRNGEIYSIHAPGVAALVLPAFAVAGYHGVVVFLLLVASGAAALAWWLAWRVTQSAAAAWFGWAAVALSAPFLVESFTVYPDGVGAAVVLTGVWALLRAEWEAADKGGRWAPWLLHGAALALLPWMHTRFVVLAATLGGLILVRLARTPNPLTKAIAFLAVPAVSALAWILFFAIVYGMPDPSAPYGGQTQNSFAYFTDGLGGLLFDQGFGLFFTAPALAAAVAGFTRVRRLAAEYSVVLISYLLTVATFAMWWAGWSGPARFLVPVVLPLAIPAACAWAATARRPGLRAVMTAALVVSLWLTAVMTMAGGRLAYHGRNEWGATAAPWAEWASPAVDLPSALPAYVPLPVGTALAARHTAARAGTLTALPWLAGCAIVVLAARRFSRLDTPALYALVTLSAALVVMLSTTIVWHAAGAQPALAPSSQLAALRTLSSNRTVVFDLLKHRISRSAEYASALTIDVDVVPNRGRANSRMNRPLAVLPAVPAGEYQLSVTADSSDGWVMVGIAEDQFAIVTKPLGDVKHGVTLRFPVEVRSMVVRSDEAARDAIRRITLRPLRLQRPAARLTKGIARRAVRYGTSVAFFLDDRAFADPSGFWVGGARSTSVVIAPDTPASSLLLAVRNAPVQNTVEVESGRWRETLTLAAGEGRELRVPIDPLRGAGVLRLRSASGFRPSDQGSSDSRFLGVFVKVN